MDRRSALKAMGAATLAAPAVLKGRYTLSAQSPQEYSARAIRLVGDSPVVDMLSQFRFTDLRTEPPRLFDRWMTDPTSFTEEDWPKYRDSGIDVLALGRGAPDRTSALEFMAQ